MTTRPEDEALLRQHHRRIRWVKRLLRPLPRRANIHRYPGLRWLGRWRFGKWLAEAARARAYLWSFRVSRVVPALWAGSILTFLPVYGIQVPLACVLAFLLRANLPLLVGLQFITNPFTIAPVYYACFEIGHIFLKLVGIDTLQLNGHQLGVLLDRFGAGDWGDNARTLAQVFGITSLGGTIVGTFLAAISTAFYQFAAARAGSTFERVREMRRRHALHHRHVEPEKPRLHRERRFFRKGRRWR